MRSILTAILVLLAANAYSAGKVSLDLGVGKVQYQIPGYEWVYGTRLGGEIILNENFRVQASYTGGNYQNNTLLFTGVKIRANGYSIGGLGLLELKPNMNFFAASGLMLWDTQIESAIENQKEIGVSLYYGFGVQFQLKKNTGVRLAHYTANIGSALAENFHFVGFALVHQLEN